MIRVELPWPPSTNHAYATIRGRRVKTKEARDYAKIVAAWLNTPAGRRARETWNGDTRFRVRLEAHPPDRRRRDLANLEKIAVDAAFAWLQQDDSRIDHLELVRLDPDRPAGRIVLEIREAA